MAVLGVKRSRGRPKVDSEAVNVRFSREMVVRLEAWITANSPAHPTLRLTRPEAVRRLVERGLGAAGG